VNCSVFKLGELRPNKSITVTTGLFKIPFSLLELLPTGALSTGLRHVLAYGAGFPVKDAVTLAVWAVAGIALAGRYFRWE